MRVLTHAFAVAALVGWSAAATAEVRIAGSTTVAAEVVATHQAEIEATSGVKLSVTQNSSGRGLLDLVDGKADIAMISAPLTDIVASANAKEPGRIDPTPLHETHLGEAKVEFVVHASNPVTSLTAEQITGILNGTTTNWNAVGGPDLPILLVSPHTTDAMRSMIERRILDGGTISEGARVMPNAPQVAQVVGQAPPAFGFVSSVLPLERRANTKVISTEVDLTQVLVLVTRGAPEGDLKRVVDAAQSVVR